MTIGKEEKVFIFTIHTELFCVVAHHMKVKSDKEIVRTVIALAHSLGLRATAEGVETDAQLAALRLLGCDFVQGFLFDQPVSLEVLRSNWITSPALATSTL